ncbi:MAG TPA: DUF2268 domain-containing putative Zn-dependent protease [Bryobacteraceae bacterium]|nr:DUF2268 domain-containing putative Zn-dependent protease [Bryobacteraceae bacterium]
MWCRFVVPVALLALAWGACAQPGPKPSHDPEAARLVTGDIPNFWRVFDKASLKDAGDLFQREYLDPGSTGLHDFVKARIQNGRLLAATAVSRPRYYSAIREGTLSIDRSTAVKDAIRASFRKLKEIYPDAVFPDVYFVVGRMTSAGTTSQNGLLIGVEMNARDRNTPVDELNDWERAVTGQIANLPNIVAHELIHIQQDQDSEQTSLLYRSLMEGGADFVGELISGDIINRVQRTYGDAHEAALWQEFRKDMAGKDVSHWLFQGDRSKDRPADLGYYIGFKICEAFYRRTPDKREAVRRILRVKDAEAFLRDSGYEGGHQPGR